MARLDPGNITADGSGNWNAGAITFTPGSHSVDLVVGGQVVATRQFNVMQALAGAGVGAGAVVAQPAVLGPKSIGGVIADASVAAGVPTLVTGGGPALIPNNAHFTVAPTASNSLPTGATPTSWKKWIAFVSAAAGQGGGAAGQQLNAGTPLASTGDTYQGQLYNGYTGAGKGGNPPAQYAQCGLAYCFAAADFNGGTNNLLTFDYAVSAENSTGQGGGTVEFFIAVHDSSGANLLAATATNALVPALGCQLMLFQSGKPTGGAEISCGNQDTSTIANAVNVNTKYTASFNLYNWVSAYLGGGKTWANANIAMVRIMMYGFCNGTQLGAYGYLGNFR